MLWCYHTVFLLPTKLSPSYPEVWKEKAPWESNSTGHFGWVGLGRVFQVGVRALWFVIMLISGSSGVEVTALLGGSTNMPMHWAYSQAGELWVRIGWNQVVFLEFGVQFE